MDIDMETGPPVVDHNAEQTEPEKTEIQQEEPEDEEQEEIVYQEDQQQEAACLMVYILRNFNRHKQVKVTLVHDPQNKAHCNFRQPVTDVTHMVNTRTDKTILKLIKARPLAGWGNAGGFRVVIDGFDLDGSPWNSWDRDFLELRLSKQPHIEAASALQQEQEQERERE